MQVFERYLTEGEERQLLRTVAQYVDVRARRDHAWMEVLRVTGVRIRAFSQLTVAHAEEAVRTGVLRLEGAIQKRGRAQRVPVAKRGRSALRRLLRIRRELGYAPRPEAPLVMSRHHRALSVRSYQARMRHWVEVAGLDVQASPHWFRHTLAKRIVARSEARDPAAIVQGVLGHAGRNSTGCYLLPDREAVADAIELAS